MTIDAAVADIERTRHIHNGRLRQSETAQHVLGDFENSLRRQYDGFVHGRTVCLSLSSIPIWAAGYRAPAAASRGMARAIPASSSPVRTMSSAPSDSAR